MFFRRFRVCSVGFGSCRYRFCVIRGWVFGFFGVGLMFFKSFDASGSGRGVGGVARDSLSCFRVYR